MAEILFACFGFGLSGLGVLQTQTLGRINQVDPLIGALATKGYFTGTPLRDLLFGSSKGSGDRSRGSRAGAVVTVFEASAPKDPFCWCCFGLGILSVYGNYR